MSKNGYVTLHIVWLYLLYRELPLNIGGTMKKNISPLAIALGLSFFAFGPVNLAMAYLQCTERCQIVNGSGYCVYQSKCEFEDNCVKETVCTGTNLGGWCIREKTTTKCE